MIKKTHLFQFIPKEFDYLTKTKKIEYKGVNLKTDYLINILHELILKYYFTSDIRFNLWSEILRKNYGMNYNKYIEYLCEKKFMFMSSDYFVKRKSKTYQVNINTLDVIRVKVTDTVLLKKHSKEYLQRSFTCVNNSPIELGLRKILIDDLYSVNINYDKALDYLNTLKDEKKIDLCKYFKNLSSIDSINTGHIFFKFDPFGRLHTNFTILKKKIRNEFLTIDGMLLDEIDVKNSQPFFFAVFLKNELGEHNFNQEVKNYVDIVKNGLIYDQIFENNNDILHSRDEAKMLMYKVLFGKNNDKQLENKIFKELYPTIFEYIKEYKSVRESYKELSHELQLIESNFIFGVVKIIKDKFPHIKLFTVHDSLVFPKKYKEEVQLIFNQEIKKLI